MGTESQETLLVGTEVIKHVPEDLIVFVVEIEHPQLFVCASLGSTHHLEQLGLG
ncbi:MAG: hypothetical protein HOE87_03065 [Candidatus Magasanikbacteria bacterium]|jgi:hypothetical protein|nr:hypothetical protein [Candidatus Magasanikbacteria bacterium]